MGFYGNADQRGLRNRPWMRSRSLCPGRLCNNRLCRKDGKSFQVRAADLRGCLKVQDDGYHGPCLYGDFLYRHTLSPDQRCTRAPFPLPLLGLVWGIALGAAGSATGNPYYGKERQYQNQKFGAGVPISASGNIVRYAEAGERNSIDNGWFTAKIGGSASGICFGLIVFLELWRTVLFESINPWYAIIAGIVMILAFTVINLWIEGWARKTYGPYTKPVEEASS
jgi:hypothetical protein